MANSKTEVVNMALAKIGGNRITNADTSSEEEAQWARQFWNTVLDATLRLYPWPCALTRRSLARSDHDDTDEWDYQYQLPSDPWCLRVLGMPDDPAADYVVEGRKLLTDATACSLLFIKRVTSVPELDPLLTIVLVSFLGSALAIPITGSRTRSRDLYQEATEMLPTAKNVAGGEYGPHKNALDWESDTSRSSYWSWKNAGR